MPGMSGLELLAEVHEIDPACKAIIVTGYGEKEYVLEAMRLGASDFLEKPLEMESFRSAVKRSYGRKSAFETICGRQNVQVQRSH
jgi:YesN/AraC family two-component response regulator